MLLSCADEAIEEETAWFAGSNSDCGRVVCGLLRRVREPKALDQPEDRRDHDQRE